MMLIGLEGLARSGKNTVGDMLKSILNNRGYKVETYAFASAIKEPINKLFDWNTCHADGSLKEIKTLVKLPYGDDWSNVLMSYYGKHVSLGSYTDITKYGKDIGSVFRKWCYSNHRVYKSENGADRSLSAFISPREMYQIFGTEMIRECICDSFWIDIAPRENVIITDVRFPNEGEFVSDRGVHVLIERLDNTLNKAVAKHSSENGTGYKPDIIVTNDSTLLVLEEGVEALADFVEKQFTKSFELTEACDYGED